MKTVLSEYLPYFKKIARLSSPIIVGQIGVVLMGVADVVMIGRIDAANLAAAGTANSVFFLICILGIGCMMALSALVAKAKGGGNNNQCAVLLRQGFVAALLMGAFISFVLFLLAANFELFRQTPEVTVLAQDFLNILNWGTIPLLLFMAAKQFSDGLSFTKPAAVITLLALLLNIFINWLLIYGNWGFPKLGLNGAGIATFIARVFMAVTMTGYVFLRPQYKAYIHIKDKAKQTEELISIFRIGLPSGFQYFFEIAAFSSAGIIIGWIGKNEQGAHTVALNIASITYMVATGISAAGSILVGNALGAKNRTDMIRSGKASLLIGALFMGLCAVILAVFTKGIISFYVSEPEVASFAVYLLLIAALFQLSDGVQCVGLGVLRGLGDTKVPTFITIVAYWMIGIPVGYFLAFHMGMSLYGIWVGLLTGLTFSALLLSVRFLKLSKRIDVFQAVHQQMEQNA